MILLNNYGDRLYVDDDAFYSADELGRLGYSDPDIFDKQNLMQFFFALTPDQTAVAICLYLGFKPKEIVEILGLKNIQSFYWINSKLKKSYRTMKDKYF